MTETKKKISPYGLIKFSTVDEYHASFPIDIQKILQQLRQTIKQVAPEAIETISYNIPTFKNLISYAAYKKHIGFYAGSSAVAFFEEELTPYKTLKGTIQFPVHKPLPIALIKKILKFRMEAVKMKSER